MPYGPCVICGATNYAMSTGGYSICPSCDCGPPNPRDVRLLREENMRLRGAMPQALPTAFATFSAPTSPTFTDAQIERAAKNRYEYKVTLRSGRKWEHANAGVRAEEVAAFKRAIAALLAEGGEG